MEWHNGASERWLVTGQTKMCLFVSENNKLGLGQANVGLAED